MKRYLHVLAYRNLWCSIGAERISLISTTCARYLTIMVLNYCNMVQYLIRCSMNCCTFPSTMFTTLDISVTHDESCSTCNLIMSRKSTKSSGVSNSRRLMSLISRLILVQLFSHLTHFSWISRWGSWAIFTQYSVNFLMWSMLLFLSTRMSCSSTSRLYWTMVI